MHKFLCLTIVAVLISSTANADDLNEGTASLESIQTPSAIAGADDLHPVSRNLRSEFAGCRSEIQREAVIFKNVGSMCVDGLYTLMLGRGCNTITGERDPTDRWSIHQCQERTTCDVLHQNSFAIVPVGVSIVDNFESTVQIFCQDNNYIILKL